MLALHDFEALETFLHKFIAKCRSRQHEMLPRFLFTAYNNIANTD